MFRLTTDVGWSGLARSRCSSSFQRCWMGLRWELCAGTSTSFTSDWENHFFTAEQERDKHNLMTHRTNILRFVTKHLYCLVSLWTVSCLSVWTVTTRLLNCVCSLSCTCRFSLSYSAVFSPNCLPLNISSLLSKHVANIWINNTRKKKNAVRPAF